MNIITRFLVAGLLIVPALLIAQSPVAHFSASNNAVCDSTYGENFTDQSANNPTSWRWYFPGATPDTSTLQNPTNIKYKGYGRYTVKLVVQNNNGSDSLTDSNYVRLYAPPSVVIKGKFSVCQGSGIHDTIIINGGDSIFYINKYPVITTTYSFVVRNGPCYLDTSLTIHVDSVLYPRFPIGDTSICVGNSTTIYAVPIKPYGGSYKYLWSTGATTDSIVVFGKAPGSYTYSVTVTKDACSYSVKITIGVHDCTGVETYDDPLGDVEVYPNPNNGKFSLMLSNVNAACNVDIYNVLGENIYKEKINSDNTEINLSGQPNGIYLYRVISENGALVGEGKVVVEK